MIESMMETDNKSKNIVVIGNPGAGKSLFCAALSNNYDKFPISDDMEREFPEQKFIDEEFTNECQNFRIFDWEGKPSCEAFKELLENSKMTIIKPNLKIHALIYVIKYGRMGNNEKTFMKEIVETFFQANNQRERTLILAVTNSTDKLINNSKFAQDWISNESVHPNSPLNYFLNDANPGENETISKSKIYFINCKNPEEEEEPEKTKELNKKTAKLLLNGIRNLIGNPNKLNVSMKGDDVKALHPSKEGVYILAPDLVNGRRYWIQEKGKGQGGNAVWCNDKKHWSIGPKENLGTRLVGIYSDIPDEEGVGPLEATNWKWLEKSSGKWIPTSDIIVTQPEEVVEFRRSNICSIFCRCIRNMINWFNPYIVLPTFNHNLINAGLN